ncbi:PREDICTED: sulfotransferase 1 family member D1-like [Priapulus caudatus]|uniref:Sulfotransferase 1 family member D1-like n=1 Tax=Priapulus caudatus TaxID=37621 RepID=A0ABM1E6U5_PRICU|nr:PREDICTED: sulfotransferase 1 family member D1-like [Priapulus caudatus]
MPIAKDISSIASRPGFVDDDIYRGYVKGIPGGQYHKGCLLQGFMTYKHLLKRIPQMKMREDDIVICSYPKSGTTWTEEIVSLIKNNGNVGKVKREIHWRVIHMETGRPFFHMRYMNNLKSRRLLATHLPFELLPTQLQNGRGKASIPGLSTGQGKHNI